MRRAAHVDANHSEIVTALLDAGCIVQSLAAVGCGVPDLLVGVQGVNLLVEVKNPDRTNSATADRESLAKQAAWAKRWKGRAVEIVTTREQALALVARVIMERG